MTNKPDNALRDSVEMWVELAVHKFNAANGVVIMGDCSAESVEEIMQFIQAHTDSILRELLEQMPEKAHWAVAGNVWREYVKQYGSNENASFALAIDQATAVIQEKLSKEE